MGDRNPNGGPSENERSATSRASEKDQEHAVDEETNLAAKIHDLDDEYRQLFAREERLKRALAQLKEDGKCLCRALEETAPAAAKTKRTEKEAQAALRLQEALMGSSSSSSDGERDMEPRGQAQL